MFLAPISLKSLSASYFKSFETLNLKMYTGGVSTVEVNQQGSINLTAGSSLYREAYLPEWPLPAQKVVLINDPCNSPAFPHTGSVTNQIAGSFPSRQESLMLLWYKSIGHLTFISWKTFHPISCPFWYFNRFTRLSIYVTLPELRMWLLPAAGRRGSHGRWFLLGWTLCTRHQEDWRWTKSWSPPQGQDDGGQSSLHRQTDWSVVRSHCVYSKKKK